MNTFEAAAKYGLSIKGAWPRIVTVDGRDYSPTIRHNLEGIPYTTWKVEDEEVTPAEAVHAPQAEGEAG